jgi:hypothetical protein
MLFGYKKEAMTDIAEIASLISPEDTARLQLLKPKNASPNLRPD